MGFVENHVGLVEQRLNVLLASHYVYVLPLSVLKQIYLLLVLQDVLLDVADIPIHEELLVAEVYGERYRVLQVRLVVVHSAAGV